MPASNLVDDRSGQPDETQANKIQKPIQKSREIVVDDEIPEHGGSHASSSDEVSLEPTFKRREDLCKHSVELILLKTEIARSATGQKLQGLRAEDPMAEPYLVLKIWVTW